MFLTLQAKHVPSISRASFVNSRRSRGLDANVTEFQFAEGP